MGFLLSFAGLMMAYLMPLSRVKISGAAAIAALFPPRNEDPAPAAATKAVPLDKKARRDDAVASFAEEEDSEKAAVTWSPKSAAKAKHVIEIVERMM